MAPGMRRTLASGVSLAPRFLLAAALLAGAGALAWYLTHRVDSTPVSVAPRTLERWSLVTSDGTDPWVVAMKPPETLVASLVAAVSQRSGAALVPPAHPALPLVLRTEFDEGLQGVYGVDSVLRIARESGVETGTFTPICLAHRTTTGPDGPAEVYYVPFESEAFVKVRVDLVPAQPEHGGIGIYDPSLLTPVVIVAASTPDVDRFLPLPFDPERDCEAPVQAGQN